MITIIDNRNNKAGLEIDEQGYGKWYAWNPLTDLIISTKFKYEAETIAKSPEEWDI